MTAVGKIMAFLVLVFSTVVLVMSLYVHSLWSEQRVEFDKLQKNYDVLNASRGALESELKEIKNVASKNRNDGKAKDQRVDLLTKDLAEKDSLIKNFQGEMKKEIDRFNQSIEAAKAEADSRQKQFELLSDTLKKEQSANIELAKQRDDMRQREVAAQIEAKNLRDRFVQMEKQLREVNKQLEVAKVSTSPSSARGATKENPPPEHVEGVVKETDPNGMIKLSIGADQGLQRGHTLQLFRLNLKAPGESKYLGSIRVLEVSNHESVGEPVRALADRARAGDRVASKILDR